ncbi:MAG: hypothetical protein EOO13_10200 [Chitinophagaceae bacterium]|nr:MAG: hypothetical protein EOO13_10200 [Chitinophagaceae bacterium]
MAAASLIQMIKRILTALFIIVCGYIFSISNSGCAQIGAPTGGIRDSIAPVLVRASPELRRTNFSGNKITLTFSEYVEVVDAQTNVLLSPYPKSNPSINYNLKTVTVRLRDTLQPNTTYSINFGNAIKDVNEGNVFENFTYVFSTGPNIDSASLQGKLLLAETGLVDSTISVALYRNADDSAVQKRRPDYLTRIKGDGIFRFTNLPEDSYKLYALKDADGNKYYNGKTEMFAFLDSAIMVVSNDTTQQPTLYAYSEEPVKDNKIIPVLKPKVEKTLKFNYNYSGSQDLLTALEITFNNPLKAFDTSRIVLLDTNYNRIPGTVVTMDSTAKKFSYQPTWAPAGEYIFIIPNDAVEDSAGNKLAKSDTLRFSAKKEADYGRTTLRFKGYDPSRNPVIQLLVADEIKFSFPLTGPEFTNSRLLPGEYTIRILYDDNKDGKWTPGNYSKKIQPEKAVTITQKLGIRADWDNERDITL